MYGDFPTVILSPSFDTRYIFELDFQCHQFEVNQHHVAEVMPALLKSGQSTSREEAVEEMKDCRSMKHHWYRSIVIPENSPSLFRDQFRPRSYHILPIYPWTTWNPILLFSKPSLTAMLHTILKRERAWIGERDLYTLREERSWTPFVSYSILFLFIY